MSRNEIMTRKIRGTTAAMTLAATLLLATTPLTAQNRPAVATPPTLGPAPDLRLPTVQETTLPSGLKIQLVEMHAVPVVRATLTISGGARLDGERPGLATFTASMLTEGAGSRDAFDLADEAEFLGASLGASASWDAVQISLSSPKRTFGQAMDLLADVLLKPAFKSADIARQRDLRITSILQQSDHPGAVASLIFDKTLFPAGHPYRNPMDGDSSSTAALDSAIVRNFWERAANPRQATLIITGDITLAEARALATQKLGNWRTPKSPLQAPANAAVPATPRPETKIILADKPGAAQSVIMIGLPGVERNSPDYAAITVMNSILGGSFSARLNDILREQKGYTYGARSGFSWRPLPGPFIAGSSVRTNVTDSSLAIFFREFEDLRKNLVPAEELERAIAYITLGALGDFETTRQVNFRLTSLNTFGLPISSVPADLKSFGKVTADDVRRVAQRYIDPKHLVVVVVGDLAAIRPGIEALGLGPILLYDEKGNPLQ